MRPCECGNDSVMMGGDKCNYVTCSSNNKICWIGPIKETKAEAEAAWDELMGERDDTIARHKPAFVVDRENYMVVICNDGAVYRKHNNGFSWEALRPIPGTEADR